MAVPALSVSLSDDTGSSNTDFITSTNSQTITIAYRALGPTEMLGIADGSDYSSWTAGGWNNVLSGTHAAGTIDVNMALSGLSGEIRVRIWDTGGFLADTMTQPFTLDTTAPAAPGAPDLTSGTDSGSDTADDVTGNNFPTFSGTAEADATVKLYDTDGTTEIGSGTADGSGNWSIAAGILSDGAHTITAIATDAAGNVSSASTGLSVEIDTAAPTGVGLSATTVATSSATAASTLSTFSATDANSVTYTLAAGNGTNDADNGSFTISGTSLNVGASSLVAGTYKIYVAAIDLAGNVSNQAFTITVSDPPGVSSIVRAGGASATVSAADTSVQYTVTFDQSVTGVDASDFALTATGMASGSIASVTGSGTTYTVTVDSIAGDGTLRLDLNGSGTGIQNGSAIDIAAGFTSGSTYTLDHTAPSAPSAPDMSTGTDTGGSSTDDNTSNTTPTFSGTAEAGATVTLYDTDGTTILGTTTAAGGNWSITSSTLSEGSHTLTATATDAAGNVSSASSGLDVTIDASAPTAPSAPDLDAASDTGASDTDDETNVSTPTFSGTAEAGATVELFDTDGTTVLGSATADGGGNWSITASALSDGSHTLTAKATDAAGNTSSASTSLGVTIDTAPSTTTITTAAFSSDTGTSSGDFITKTAAQTISGTTSANIVSGERVEVSVDNGSTWANAAYTVGSNTWSYATTLSGTGTLKVRVTDTAGNSGTVHSQAYVLDTSAPSAPGGPDLAAGSDTGSSNTDNETSDSTPTFSGTAEANSTVRLYDTDGTTQIGSGSADGSGNWSITTSTLSEGSHTVTAKATDTAGNTSSASSGLGVTIDTTAPAAPGTPDLAAGSDSGTSSADDLTNDDTPTFSGTAEANATVTLYDTDGTTQLGSGTADGSGNWTITSSTLGDGAHTVTAKATDAAGNTSVASSGIDVTVDTTAPTKTDDTDTATETGTSAGSGASGDVLSNDSDLHTLSVYAVGGLTGQVGTSVSGTYGTFEIAADGSYTYTVNDADGTVDALANSTDTLDDSIGYTVQDAAGNTTTATLTVTIEGANDAPTSAADSVTFDEDTPVTLAAADFGAFTDVDNGDSLKSVQIVGLPTNGSLKLNGVAVNANDIILASDIDGGLLVYTPASNDSTDESLTFKVIDQSDAASGTYTLTLDITPVNDSPTGAVTIGGSALVGSTLTASNTLGDVDGLGAIGYQWSADGTPIAGANSSTYLVDSLDIGKAITVTATYIDGDGTTEQVDSAATGAVGSTVTPPAGSSTLTGTAGDDVMDGSAKGGQTMIGGLGDDTYIVDSKQDKIVESGGGGTDSVDSSTSYSLAPNVENLTLTGTRRADATGNDLDNDITGNDGINRIKGGLGADTLTGGAGADVFVYLSVDESPAGAYDTIMDFNVAEGDRIDLRKIDATPDLPGKSYFIFIGSQDFSDFAGVAGLCRFDAGTHMLECSTDTDSAAEFQILLVGVSSLTAANIVL